MLESELYKAGVPFWLIPPTTNQVYAIQLVEYGDLPGLVLAPPSPDFHFPVRNYIFWYFFDWEGLLQKIY